MTKLTKHKRMQGHSGQTRQGYALVLFVFLMWVFVGLAALVIDLGFVRLTQRQMQTAADSAALEGLRFRDHFPVEWLEANPDLAAEILSPDAAGPPPESPQTLDDAEWQVWREQVARYMASRRVRQSFKDAESIGAADDGNALQVRLRRSVGNSDTVGDDLPSLFARASLGPGFSVSYSGIAAAGGVELDSTNVVVGRAVAVGQPVEAATVAEFAVELSAWNMLPGGDVFEPIAHRGLPPDGSFLHIGLDIGNFPASTAIAGDLVIPIYSPIAIDGTAPVARIVGFGFASVDSLGRLNRHEAPTIPRENATASFRAVPEDFETDVPWREVLLAFEDVTSPLVCPVLVQRNLGPTPD